MCPKTHVKYRCRRAGFDSLTLLPQVIMHVSISKCTINHGFVVFFALIYCWFSANIQYSYILHASDRNLSLDVIGC